MAGYCGLEQVHLVLDVGHPGPEGEVRLGGHRCVDFLLSDLIRFGGVRTALVLAVSAAGQDEGAGGGCHRKCARMPGSESMHLDTNFLVGVMMNAVEAAAV